MMSISNEGGDHFLMIVLVKKLDELTNIIMGNFFRKYFV